ncbi:MAG: AbrB/MazE/SpoVT family DNA-binding domain-containing protein [bacterium]
MSRATVGKRYQVVIPLKERAQLDIRPNTKVEVVAEEGRLVIYPLTPPRLKGIGREIADGTDATDYVSKLRKEWERRL